MARQSSQDDFTVTVEGIGSFTFGRRKMRDEMKIQSEYARILDGATPTEWLELFGGWVSALKVLTVRAPEGWNIDEMDPLDSDTYSQIMRVHDALRERETFFRKKPGQDSQEPGARDGNDDTVPVSPEVQPAGH